MTDIQTVNLRCMLRGDANVTLAARVRPGSPSDPEAAASRMEKLNARAHVEGEGSASGTPAAAGSNSAPPDSVPDSFSKAWCDWPDAMIERDGSLAIVHLSGAMSFGYDIYDWFEGGLWNVQVAAAIDQVAGDSGVRAVLFKANSPGGTCSGMHAVIAACARLRASKKEFVGVLANEDCCSCMYWIACAVTQDRGQNSGEIVASATATVGSIGVKCVTFDLSEAYKQAGIRVVALSTGKRKTDHTPGLSISEETEAQMAAQNEELFADFLGDVALARGLNEKAVRDFEGAYYHGKGALAKGLVDAVVDPVAYIAKVRGAFGQNGTAGTGSMNPAWTATKSTGHSDGPSADKTESASSKKSNESNESTAQEPVMAEATLAQLKEIFGGDSTSVLASFEAKHTVEQAQGVLIQNQKEAIAEAETAGKASVAKLEEENRKLRGLAPQSETDPLGNGGNGAEGAAGAGGGGAGGAGKPVSATGNHPFEKAVKAYATANKVNMGAAMVAVASEQPQLHEAYMKAAPKSSGRPSNGNIGSASRVAQSFGTR